MVSLDYWRNVMQHVLVSDLLLVTALVTVKSYDMTGKLKYGSSYFNIWPFTYP